MDLHLDGKSAILGASSRGLGLACATALAAEGVNVVINGRDGEVLEKAAALVREGARDGVEVLAIRGDIASENTQLELLEACPAPDILVTNNGGPPAGSFRNASSADWRAGVDANFLTHVELINRVVNGMCQRGFGRIVNITSAMVTSPRKTMAVSSAARAGLTAAVKALSHDVAPYGVTVNNMQPERFDTERQQYQARVAMERDGVSYEEARALQVASVAAGRLGDPAEFGAACTFLCSPLAGFISGQNLRLDGGSYAGLI
jgi:3-oxoacyl-[acyl-carrier protein] reductase